MARPDALPPLAGTHGDPLAALLQDDRPTPADADSSVPVLLIDDDEDDFLLCSDMLAEAPLGHRYRLTWASDPATARGALTREHFDVILLDHYLGPITGLEFLDEVKSLSPAPVVLLTGRGDPGLDEAAMRAGASDYLTKTEVTPELLERSLRHAIERQRAQRALQASETRYRTLVASLQESVVVQDREGRFLTVNDSAAELLRLDRDPVSGELTISVPVSFLREDGSRWPLQELPNRVTLRTGEPRSGVVVGFQVEDREVQWLSVNTQPMTPPGADMPSAVLMSFIDITERFEDFQTMRHRAFHDPLTGLPNRLLFMDRLNQALNHAQRSNEVVAVGLIDLDRFKDVNDRLGHAAGDEVLRQVAQRLQSIARDSDSFARLGGDELTMLLRDVKSAEHAKLVARRIIDAFQNPLQVAGQQVRLTVSLGLSLAPKDGIDAEELLNQADRAAYWVKGSGRNAFALFDADEAREVAERVRLEADLHRSVARDELELEFQPIVDLRTGATSGLEALLRWRHPHQGRIPPLEFVPLAEETGLIAPIGEWVLRQACVRARDWSREQPGTRVAVNVSAVQFQRRDLVEVVEEALESSGLPAEQLEIELTESAVMMDVASSIEQMSRLKALGVRLAVDDFGTGYSSLVYLQRLPIDVIKIDREFIRSLSSPAGSLLVNAITELAHRLDIEVTAEGVETESQLTVAEQLGCQYAQGFFLGRPQAEPAFPSIGARGATEDGAEGPPSGPLPSFLRSLDGQRAAVVVTDARDRIVFANRSFLAQTGRSREELVGRVPRLRSMRAPDTGSPASEPVPLPGFGAHASPNVLDIAFADGQRPVWLQLKEAAAADAEGWDPPEG